MFLRLGRVADLTSEQTEVMAAGLADGSSFAAEHFDSDACLGYAAGVDRGLGKVCVVSTWATADALAASRRAADRARAAQPHGEAAEIVVDEYEVALERTAGRGWSEPAGCIRLSRVAGLVDGRVPELVAAFADHVAELSELEGFAGYLVGQDAKNGRVTAISRWRTRADLEASEPMAARARAARLDAVKPRRSPQVDRYDVIAIHLARARDRV